MVRGCRRVPGVWCGAERSTNLVYRQSVVAWTPYLGSAKKCITMAPGCEPRATPYLGRK